MALVNSFCVRKNVTSFFPGQATKSCSFKRCLVALSMQRQQLSPPTAKGATKFPPLFDRGEKVGEGTYGWVYLANSKETRKRFALKHFKDGRVSDR